MDLSKKALIGMVHVGALPGTPGSREGIGALASRAAGEARVLKEAGFDAVMIENMHDAPYVHGAQGPEVVAGMTAVGLAVRAAVGGMSMGVQVLSGGNKEALAVALACGALFVRCENFVFSHVADEGLLERAEAGPLLRYRRVIGAEGVRVYCDVKKKHASHAITGDLSVGECVRGAEFFGADGVIVTGVATGRAASVEDVKEARGATGLPVLVGSGVTPEQVRALFRYADGLIVGSWVKRDGSWNNEVDPGRAKELARAAALARGA
ncbi:MAG: BtpA/SgcQ family protein [Phycisphaeraceae bacterium]|nr:MAG: BtpA/SgcQ family protein [Phycisphaeraceae bacterium]